MSEGTVGPIFVNSAKHRVKTLEELRDLAAHSHLLRTLVQRDITVRYKRSFIGFFWTMLNPLLLMIILSIVFAHIFKFEGIKYYAVYFLSEYLVFNFFAQTTVQSMTSLAWNGGMMKKVRVPKSIFAISTTLSGLVNLCLAYVPLFVIMIYQGAPIRITVLFLPVAFLIIGAFTLGVSFFLSAMAVYFEDVTHMYQVATLGLMYITPIIYPISIIPDSYLWVIRINPLTHLFKLARDPVYLGQLPAGHVIQASIASAVIALVVGWFVFHRMSRNFYHYL